MIRSDLEELHYITPIDNLPSIISKGILCYREAQEQNPTSVASEEVQDIRSKKVVPNGLPLHQYANVYFTARNPMLYKLRHQRNKLIILGVNPDLLDLPGVVIADGNAASDYTAFWPSPNGLERVDDELVFADYWTDDNIFDYWAKKRIKCAEVLVPRCVEPRYIVRIIAPSEEIRVLIQATGVDLPIYVSGNLFFQSVEEDE